MIEDRLDRANAFLKSKELSYLDDRVVRELIGETVEEWLEYDLETFDIIGTEIEYIIPTSFIPFKMIVDLELRIKKLNPQLAKLGLKEGDLGRLDWKTSAMNFSNYYGVAKFKEVYKDSFQWKLYSELPDEKAKFFIYRGISKVPEGGNTQLILIPHEDMEAECLNYIRQGRNAILSQYGEPLPWYKRMPEGCSSYGVECPYLKTCKLGTPAVYLIDPPPMERGSFSSFSSFWTCPERWRRDRLEIDADDDTNDATKLGKLFHEVIAVVYDNKLE